MTDPNAQTPYEPPAGQPYQQPAGQPYSSAPGQPYPSAPGQPYQPGAANPNAANPGAPLTQAEDKQWATWSHFGGIIGPLPSLIIFLVFKDRGAFTRQESKEALNWQITWFATFIILNIILAIISSIMWATATFGSLGVIGLVTGVIGFIAWLPYLANIVFSIMGGMKVNGGSSYRYPFAVRLIK